MAITKRPPNTIFLGGRLGQHPILINEYVASAAITPGMLIEQHNDGGVNKWRPHSAAANMQPTHIALESLANGKTVDDAYAANDLVYAAAIQTGETYWMIVASGQDITNTEALQSNGDGRLKAATDLLAATNVARFIPLDNLGAVAAHTRCRVEVN
jgi:hypothetical protein